MSKCVFVTGATGFIGSHLVERLIAEGYLVKALARSSSDIPLLQSLNVDIVAGDVRDAATLEAGNQRCAYVYQPGRGDDTAWRRLSARVTGR